MKQCPFCKANIDDNARFCLYCMTPLVEKEEVAAPKRRGWNLPILIAVLAGFLLTVGVGAFMIYRGSRDPQGDTLQNPSQTPGTSEAATSGTGAQAEEQPLPEQTGASEPEETTKPVNLFNWLFPDLVTPNNTTKDTTPTSAPNNTAPGTSTPSTTTAPTSPATTTAPTTAPTTVPTTAPTTAPTTEPTTEPTTAPTTEPTTEATTEPDWRDYGNGIPGTEGYRTALAINARPEEYEDKCLLPLGENPDVLCGLATAEDMDDPNYVNPGNECITSVPGNYSPNGICYIPAYVGDNYKVVAIGKTLGEMVSVFLPETIVYIAKNAFRCNYKTELAYVHIASDMVDIHADAFPVTNQYTVVLRTSAECKNSDGEYYKDIAGRYGCVWEEWNG